MEGSRPHIAVQPGDGLVGRFGDTALLIAGPIPPEGHFVDELVATVEAGVAETALPGSGLAHRLGELLLRAGSSEVASFGLLAPVEGGALVLLHGGVDAEISEPSGTWRLSGRQAVTWVDHVLTGPFERLSVSQGDPGAVSVHPRADLRVGLVPGAGFVVTPGGAAPGAVPSAAASGESELAPTEATSVAGDEEVRESVASREARPLFDQAAEPTPDEEEADPLRSVGAHVQGPFGAEDAMSGSSGRATAAMAATAAPPDLVGTDGSRTTLDGDYVLGREPGGDASVRNRKASPLQVDDPDQLVSRVHAYLSVDQGVVFVRDAPSANGTFVAAPGAKSWTRIGEEESTELPIGWSLRLGGRVFSLERAGRPSQSSSSG